MSDTPVVVQAALGFGPGGADGFSVPATDDEVVADALAAWDAGAAVIELRARLRDGAPSSRAEHFAPLIERIRAAGCDAILALACTELDANGLDCLALRPELVSLDGPPQPCRALAELRDSRTALEVRCRDLEQVRTLVGLRDEGLIDDPLRVQLVVADGAPDPIEWVQRMRSLLPPGAIWSATGGGVAQLRLNVLCLIAGGHVSTGLEDNRWLVEDVPATNEELVQRVVRIVDELDRPLATPDEAREILRLHPAEPGPVLARRHSLMARAVDLRVAAG